MCYRNHDIFATTYEFYSRVLFVFRLPEYCLGIVWWKTSPCIRWIGKLLLFVFLALQPFRLYFPQPRSGLLASSFSRFLDHTQRRATFGRTPLEEWSFRRRDLYLTTHNTHNRQTSKPRVGFEPTVWQGERP